MDDNKINKNIVISSLMWKGFEKVLSQGSNLIIQIILARLLLPSDFGSLAIIVALVNYISVFVQSWLTTAIIQKKEINQVDINTLFTISISIAAFCYAALFFLAPILSEFYNNEDLVTPIRVTATVLFLYSYNSLQMGILSRRMEFKLIFVRTAIAVPLSGILSIIMVYMGFGLWSLIANFILNILLASIVMAIGTKTKVWFQFSWNSAKELYSFSIKILGAHLISGFSDLFRTMIIGKKYTTSELAYYDRAYTYANVILQIVNNSIQSVLLPVFSRRQEEITALKEMSRKSIRLTAFFVTPLLLGAVVIAKPLVLILLTEKWLPMVPFFMLFCIFRWPGCIVGIDKQVILAVGKSSIIFWFELFLLLSNFVMLLITVPISIKSIAIGALIVEYLGCFVIVVICRRLYYYTLLERVKDLYKPIINSFIMMVVMLVISQIKCDLLIQLIIQGITGVIVYYIMSLITKDSSVYYLRDIIRGKIKQIKIKNYD